MSIFLYILTCLVTIATSNAKNKPPGKTLLSPRHTRKTAETFGISSTNSFLCNELKAFLSGELIQNYCNKHIDNQNKLN